MAPKRFGKRAGKQADGGKFVKAALVYKLYTKAKLRSYADKNGCLLLTNGEKPKRHFTVQSVRQELTSETSELINRPPMGVNLAASTLEGGFDVLQLFPAQEKGAAGDRYASTGVPKAAAMFAGEVRDLAAYLSVANEKCTDREEHEQKCAKFLKFFGKADDAEARMKSYAVLADVGARLYGLAMTAIEVTSLAASPKSWARRLEHLDKQPSGVRRFAKDSSLKTLAAAVAKVNTARLQKRPAGLRFGASGSGDSASAAPASSADDDSDGRGATKELSSSASSSPDRKAKKKRAAKGGKARVRRGVSPSTASPSSAPERKRKRGGARSVKAEKKPEKDVDGKMGKASKEQKKDKRAKRRGFGRGASGSSSSAPPQADKEREAKTPNPPKEASETETVEAKYLLWPVALVQEFVSVVDTAMQGVGRDDADGVFSVAEILSVRDKIPAEVLATEPALVARLTAIQGLETVPSKEARKVLRMLAALGTTVETFFDGQTGAGASASSAAPRE